MFRAMIAERFPDHDVLAEELGGGRGDGAPSRHRWVFDPIDGTTNYAHGLPIFCASLALEIDGARRGRRGLRPDAAASCSRPSAAAGAFLNGTPLRVSAAGTLHRRAAGHRLSLRRARRIGRARRRCSARSSARRAPCGGSGSAALDLCYVAAGRIDGFWEQQLKPWDVAAGALIVAEAGGQRHGHGRGAVHPAAAHVIASNGHLHDAMLEVIKRAPQQT